MSNPIFTLIPSGYKTSLLYSVLPENGDGDFTSTRASYAYRMNKDGIYEKMQWYQPRLDYNGSTKKIYKNLIPFSSLSNYWGIGANVDFEQIEGIDPFGKSTEELYDVALVSTTSHQIELPFIELTVGETYTLSVYLKSDSSESFQIAYYDNGLQVIGDIVTTIGDSQWHRYSVTILIPAGAVAIPRIRLNGFSIGAAGATYQFWGVQAELGSTATDYESTITDLGYEKPFELASCPSVLSEDTSTNLVPYSSDLTAWNDVLVTVEGTSTISPNGLLEGAKVTRTTTEPNYISSYFNKTASALTYTSSIFVKRGNTDELAIRSQGTYPARVDLRYNFETNSIYYTNPLSGFVLINTNVENYPNGWTRLSWTYTTDAGTLLTPIAISPRLTSGNTDSSDTSNYASCYAWGGQCEEFTYATSYIETTGSSATRVSDVTETSPILGNIIDSKKGTMYANIASTDSLGTSQGVRLCLDGSRTDNSIRFMFSYNGVRVIYRVAGTSTLDWSTVADITEFQKCAISWSEDKLLVVVNGEVVATLPLPYLLSGLDLLDAYGGVRIKEWKVWDEELTEAELIALTTL